MILVRVSAGNMVGVWGVGSGVGGSPPSSASLASVCTTRVPPTQLCVLWAGLNWLLIQSWAWTTTNITLWNSFYLLNSFSFLCVYVSLYLVDTTQSIHHTQLNSTLRIPECCTNKHSYITLYSTVLYCARSLLSGRVWAPWYCTVMYCARISADPNKELFPGMVK